MKPKISKALQEEFDKASFGLAFPVSLLCTIGMMIITVSQVFEVPSVIAAPLAFVVVCGGLRAFVDTDGKMSAIAKSMPEFEARFKANHPAVALTLIAWSVIGDLWVFLIAACGPNKENFWFITIPCVLMMLLIIIPARRDVKKKQGQPDDDEKTNDDEKN